MSLNCVPPHVPAERVRPFPWYGWKDETGDPALRVSKELEHLKIFYAPSGERNPYGAWVLTRYEDMQKVLTDTTHFTSNHIAGWNNLVGLDELLIPIELDPPTLQRYRAFMAPFFARSQLQAMQPLMRDGARRAIQAIAKKSPLDVAPLGYKMTSGAWCALMGIDYDEVDPYIEHLWGMLHQYDFGVRFATAQRLLNAARKIYEANRGTPRPGMFNAFVNGLIDGRRPTDSECTGFILFQLMAGLDTMGTTAVWALRHLADCPDDQGRLRDDPSLISGFIEEVFRRYAILATNRFVTKDYVIDGVTLKPGDNVLLPAAMACMDATHFSCPAVFRIGRKERHLAFGAGAHFCIGAPMARAQLPIFLEEWLRLIPTFRRQAGEPLSAHTGDLTGLDSLPLEWS